MSEKSAKMYALVEGWHKGHQSKADYCKSVPINIHTFTYWVQKYKAQQSVKEVPKFIPLTVEKTKPAVLSVIELNYPNGVRLCVNGQPDVELLRALIKITI